MDFPKTTAFMDRIWDDEIIPALTDYIRIPNKSPAFDPDWEAHGHMEKAVTHVRRLGARQARRRSTARRWKWCGCPSARR